MLILDLISPIVKGKPCKTHLFDYAVKLHYNCLG
jgi:hypothetical protein